MPSHDAAKPICRLRLGSEAQERSWDLLKPNGLLVGTATPPDQDRAKVAGARAAFVFAAPDGSILAELAEKVDAMQLRPIIGQEMALADIGKAHTLSESGQAKGKIVLHVGTP